MGGGGSGKSVFISQLLIIRVFALDEAVKALVVRNVMNDNRESTFAELKKRISEMELDEFFKINKTSMEITCLRNGNTIIFRGLDDIERVKSIEGITQIWIEEASEIGEKEFDQLDIRLRNERDTYENQIFLTFNPISQNHWLKKRFFDMKNPRANVMKTTYHDNPYLPDINREQLEAMKETSPYYYQVYCLGEWGVIGESVFDRELIGRRMDEVFGDPTFIRGHFVFDYVDQMIINETISFVRHPEGLVTLFKEPEDIMPYVVGADTAGTGIDNFAVIVLNNYNGEQVAQIYRADITEKEFTDQLYCLGMWYNEAMVNPETNYSTYPVLELARMEYPTLYKRENIGTNDGSRTENRYGFVTGKTTRNAILSLVDNYVRNHSGDIYSEDLLDEMSSFVVVEKKSHNRKSTMRQEAAQGSHDDLIMAFGISLFTRDQWEKDPKPERKPLWKQNQFDPLGLNDIDDEPFELW